MTQNQTTPNDNNQNQKDGQRQTDDQQNTGKPGQPGGQKPQDDNKQARQDQSGGQNQGR